MISSERVEKVKKGVKKISKLSLRQPILFITILFFILFLWDLILLPFSKKTKIITVKLKSSSNLIGQFRSPTMSYILVDENGDNYTYDYNGLLQNMGLQKTRYKEYFNIHENDKIKITYFGFFTRSILDIEELPSEK